jgi:hypothetical protein
VQALGDEVRAIDLGIRLGHKQLLPLQTHQCALHDFQ